MITNIDYNMAKLMKLLDQGRDRRQHDPCVHDR